MSMQTNCVYGIGFNTDNITDDAILRFVRKHTNEHDRKVINSIEDIMDVECNLTGNEGPCAAISNIMQAETNIQFQFECGQEDCPPAIIFAPAYPWEISKEECALSRVQLKTIIQGYMDELGLWDYEPEDIRIEYFS